MLARELNGSYRLVGYLRALASISLFLGLIIALNVGGEVGGAAGFAAAISALIAYFWIRWLATILYLLTGLLRKLHDL
ncbi:hypothetical protein [Kineosporia babensis]|uniref:Uncharacterized protein n=1 Tax=Kineosporia babensis TaxID=499548 RepID=A0A9X1NKY5_9ACTN|nr:hypothetical protein [Kineosporia babensis]MCD5316862.1 hypothetical protein [Kineosporia babensis]